MEGRLFVKVGVPPHLQGVISQAELADIRSGLHQAVGATVIEEYPEIKYWQLVDLRGRGVEAAMEAYKAAFVRLKAARVAARPERRAVLDALTIEVAPNDKFVLPPDEYGPIFKPAAVAGQSANTATAVTPNDPLFSVLVGLHNTGQVIGAQCPNHTGGRDDADIDAPEAWTNLTGGEDVVVAVADTGVQYDHEDLSANMWRNPGEVAGNGVDDDRNGVVDDVFGYDGVSDDGDPSDGNGHGTHCAGTIGGVGNNGIGVAGVNWKAKIMAVKLMNDGGGSEVDWVVRAYRYMIKMRQAPFNINLRVTSNSWAFTFENPVMRDAFETLGNLNVLNVVAAANAGTNNDVTPYYPANFTTPNLLSIAASNTADDRAEFDTGGGSNWGAQTVHIAAPGKYIISSWVGGAYRCASGTSMATPHVAGAATLLAQRQPSLTAGDIRAKLLETGDPLRPSWNTTPIASMRRLNLANALGATGPGPANPGRILFVSNRDGNREIYVMNLDGSGQTRLTSNPADDYNPAWSPDGRKIVFTSNRDGNAEIYVMNADGTEPTNISNSSGVDEQPNWGAAQPSPSPSPGPGPGNLKIDRHVNTTLSDDTADRFLADGLEILRSVDRPEDVSTVVNLKRDGQVGTFNVGDGIVNTIDEKDQIFNLPSGHVHAVTDLQVCGNRFNVSYIGCSGTNQSLIVEVMNASGQQDGILWMHEYGHNRGLDHRNDPFAVMHETINSQRRQVNQAEHDRYVVPFNSPGVGGIGTEQPGQSEDVQDVRVFVRRLYPGGISYARASRLPASAVPVLLEMLADRRDELYWTNIITTLGMIGSPTAVEPLIRYLESSDQSRAVSLAEFKARLAVPPALGYILAKGENDRAFRYLRDGLRPEVWSGRLSWKRPDVAAAAAEPNTLMTDMCIWGLALSGRPEAGTALTELRANVARERARFNADTERVITDALEAHRVISQSGLMGYYSR